MSVLRVLIALTVVGGGLARPPGAWADPVTEYPSKPVRIVIGPSGNFTDIVTRRLSQQLHERWQQPVVVENRASSMISSGVVAKSTSDGHTLLISDRTWQAVAQSLFRELPYNPVKDFSEIS